MVKIVDFKTISKDDGSEFCALVVQGGIEAIRSQETNRMYFTARTVNVPCTFNESTCEALIGTDFPGSIQKVKVKPYEFVIPDTGEVITLRHRHEYVSDEEKFVGENVIEKELVN